MTAKKHDKKHDQKHDPIKHEMEYVEFLRKRLESDNFKANVSMEEFEKVRAKYNKAKLKLRMLTGKI